MFEKVAVSFASFVFVFFLLAAAPYAFGADIPNGGSVSGSIESDGDVDIHTFSGTSGQEGVISVSGNVSTGELIRVFNPDGSELVTTSSREGIVLEQSGTYTVEVSSFQDTGTGDYEVHLALAPGANEHGSIPNGGSASESIDEDGEIDSFTFSGSAGQEGVISVSGNVSTGEFYRIFNPDGTELTSESAQAFVTLPQTGDYTVVTSSFQDDGTGSYTMHVALAPGANEHGSIPNGGSVSESIDDDGEIDSFTFSGSAGQEGVISISGRVSTGEFLRVFDPDGTQLGSTSSDLSLNVTQSGTYTVVARSFQTSGTGQYSISLMLGGSEPPAIADADLTTAIGASGSVTLSSNDPDGADTLSFQVTTAPANGSASLGTPSVDGTDAEVEATYTPDPGFSGDDSFVVTASDDTGLEDTATVSVTVTAPVVDLAPEALDFGAVEVDTTSDPLQATLANTGDAPLDVDPVPAPTGPFAVDSAITDCLSDAFTLQPGASCTLGYVFAPTSTGTAQIQVEIASNADSSPDTLTLTSTGVLPPAKITVMPSAFNFGDVQADDAAVSDLVVVENAGEREAVLEALEVVGAEPGPYSLENDICSGATLAAGEVCGFEIRFAPTEAGIFRARVQVPSDAPDSPAEASLIGTSGVMFFDGFEGN